MTIFRSMDEIFLNFKSFDVNISISFWYFLWKVLFHDFWAQIDRNTSDVASRCSTKTGSIFFWFSFTFFLFDKQILFIPFLCCELPPFDMVRYKTRCMKPIKCHHEGGKWGKMENGRKFWNEDLWTNAKHRSEAIWNVN